MKKITLLLILIFFSCKNPSTKSNEKDETIDDIEYVDLIGFLITSIGVYIATRD